MGPDPEPRLGQRQAAQQGTQVEHREDDPVARSARSGESRAVADRPADPPAWDRLTPDADPEITAVNAPFPPGWSSVTDSSPRTTGCTISLTPRPLQTAPGVSLERFKRQFRGLAPDPDESEYRKALVDVTRAYAGGGGDGQTAAD